MEINLKQTPLSEIDLSRIDYEKSYVNMEGKRYKILKIVKAGICIEEKHDWDVIFDNGVLWFQDNGLHCYNLWTLHLFYKEQRDCTSCLFFIKTSIGWLCDADGCDNNHSGWQPKESVKDENKKCTNCAHYITTDFGPHCTKDYRKCDNYSNWQPKESVKENKSCQTCGYCHQRIDTTPCFACKNTDKWIATVKNLHPIVIEYQDLGDTVKIVKIEGVMSKREVTKHVGQTTAEKYFSACTPYMHFDLGKLGLNHKAYNGEFIYVSLYIGSSYDKNNFLAYIETMKLASERLAQLIKDSKKKTEPKIKRIEI